VNDLPRWYNAADVFVMPNREIDGDTEGFGMVFIEASACGTPVVAGRAGGTASSVNEGVSGFRVDGTSVPDLARCLDRLLSQRDATQRLGAQGRAWVASNFSWARVALKTTLLDHETKAA
jgi:phosphatidylinositol alpha-1,6-mannosyltransferase